MLKSTTHNLCDIKNQDQLGTAGGSTSHISMKNGNIVPARIFRAETKVNLLDFFKINQSNNFKCGPKEKLLEIKKRFLREILRAHRENKENF